MQSFFVKNGFWLTPFILGPIATLAIDYPASIFQLFPDVQMQWGIPAKLAFITMMLAFGMYQYEFFYSESIRLEERLERRDYGPGWTEYIQEIQRRESLIRTEEQQQGELQQSLNRLSDASQTTAIGYNLLEVTTSINRRAEAIERWRSDINERNQEVQKAAVQFQESIRSTLLVFSIRLSLIFTVGFLLFASLVFDLVTTIFDDDLSDLLNFNPYRLSFSSFTASVLLFFILMLAYLFIVQGQLRQFYKQSS